MPVKINCPRCNATMNMPESMYGKAVRCPSCKSPFQCPSAPPSARPAPAAAPPQTGGGGSANPFAFDAPVIAATPAAGYDQEDPYAYRPRPRMRGWDAVPGGFLFLYISAACFYLGLLIPLLLTESPSKDTAKILLIGIMILYTAGYVLAILGVGRC